MEHHIVDILLVEDNPHDAELALRALKSQNLINRVEWVKDGEQALDYVFLRGEYAHRNPDLPRVIMLDLRLPKVDGIEVLREIRSHDQTRNLPVVILTSSKEECDLVQTYELGVNSFVTKPIEFEEFANKVAQLGFYWVLVNRVPPDIREP